MTDIARLRQALIERILKEDGSASRAERRAAFDHAGVAEPVDRLVALVALQAGGITDKDIAAAKAAGFSEDQIFEIVVCAAVGQAVRQHDAALAALRVATGEG